ncbi:glutamate carboxypeptidase [Acrocarpospora pleiomorpha]|uniref:Glutamate carboxypeptidase n=1 Tax=Acrocarpospora pleiomorpha TaxID=90975 RepID=A0A5M3XIU1_9ACTN|nr:M20/M25/M40 family metallo-hydrolase [Acrocarpospora pleiomorpha]GES17978.1 glutamate carboxypeptidase [Acrocarpospora pleiomorpha]
MTSTDRPVRRLAELAAIESPSRDRAGLEACYDLLTEWAPPGLGTPVRVLRDGVPHLYWEGRPAAGKPVLLLGHADTVWPRGTLAGWPCLVRDGRVTGPGVFDMKAGLVVAMESMAGVAGGVRMLVTGDEEVGSPTSRELLEEVVRECSAVLVLEPSADGAVKTARKGCAIYQITIEGRAAHAGLEPERGVNALVELAHQVLAIAALGDPERGTTVTPTVAMAGTTVNSVPESARIDVDVRSWHLEELRRVDRALGELRPRLPEAAILRAGGINRPPLERELSAGLLETARRVARTAGLPPPAEARVGGASDGNFTAALGVPTLDGLGPLGGGAHARHEWVDARAFGERVALVAGVISALVPPPG